MRFTSSIAFISLIFSLKVKRKNNEEVLLRMRTKELSRKVANEGMAPEARGKETRELFSKMKK